MLAKGHERQFQRQPINEVIASELHRRLLLPKQYVPYSLEEDCDGYVSTCDCFITREEEYIPAWHIMKDVFLRGDKTRNPYERFVAHAVRIGGDEDEISQAIDRMLICDFILANQDRHMGNFGLIRNINTLEIKPAPLFDSGNSLWYSAPTPEFLTRTRYAFRTRPFDENPIEQLRLVKHWDWLDFDSLNGFAQWIEQFLGECSGDAEMAHMISDGVTRQIHLLELTHPFN